MTDAPKIDTQAPDTSREAVSRHIDDLWEMIPASWARQTENLFAALLAERDLADARAAAAWIAGRDASAETCSDLGFEWAEHRATESLSDGAEECANAIRALTPPADTQAALDRLIAERVREARAEAFNEAAGIARAEVERREAAMEKAVMCDSILRLSAEADAAERIAIAIVEAARGSKEGQ